MSEPVVGGLVLAAGGSRRFGSPKQLAELDGVPLLQHAVDAMLGALAVDPVVVVLGAHAGEVERAIALDGARAVRCAGWEEGMAASLRCGVAALGGARCDWVVVTLGDQPRITAQVVAAVAHAPVASPPGTAAVRAAYAGAPGHPVALGREPLARVTALRGDVGARDLLSGAAVRTIEAAHLCDPADVDTPEELEALRP